MLAAGFPVWVGVLSAVLGIVGILSAAYVVLRSGLAQKTADLWKAEADALSARLSTVEEGEKQCKSRLAAVEATNKLLIDQVTGASAIAALQVTMEKRHEELAKRLEDIGKALDRRVRDGRST